MIYITADFQAVTIKNLLRPLVAVKIINSDCMPMMMKRSSGANIAMKNLPQINLGTSIKI